MSGFDLTEAHELLRPKTRIESRTEKFIDIRQNYWQSVDKSPESLEWLKKYNCTDFYKKHKERFMYDPKSNRVMFLVESKGIYVDAIGRKLEANSDGPKWYKYGESGLGFYAESLVKEIQRVLSPIVIVEDAASACSVSRLYPAYALLGTNITTNQIIYLNSLENNDILIALDPDALLNAADIKQKLGSYGFNVGVVQLSNDPKYLDVEELKKYLKFGE